MKISERCTRGDTYYSQLQLKCSLLMVETTYWHSLEKSETKSTPSKFSSSEVDPGFLERGLIGIKVWGWGFTLLILSHFS